MKPYKGRIRWWCACPTTDPIEEGSLGYYIRGVFVDYPSFKGNNGWTSDVVAREGNEIETRNSRYTLVNG